ncbi:MAG: hypothetical protein HY671_00885 [Chloroflexi bacterium]|nr:hypothetical protein [Chloroflexota bacterium]
MVTTTEKAPVGELSEKLARMKAELILGKARLDVERLRFLEESYAETEDQPTILRRARLLEKLLAHKTLYVDEDPIIGTVTKYKSGVYPYPEFSCGWMQRETSFMTHVAPVEIAPDDQEVLQRAVEQWRNRCVWALVNREAARDGRYQASTFVKSGVWVDDIWFPQGFCTLNYPKVLSRGMSSLIEEAEQRRRQGATTPQQKQFYEAAIITLKAVLHWVDRYVACLRETARKETDPQRVQELLEAAAICERVPAFPARTFKEAVQSFWFTHVAAQIEQSACGYSPGRFGQYLNPYYLKDRSEGRITPEQAIEWFGYLFLKILAIGLFQPESFQRSNLQTGHSISLGGLTSEGNDATCELDYLLLETQRRLRVPQPSLTVFYHDKLPGDFLLKCVDVIRTGVGQPQFLNNDVAIARLKDLYPELSDAEARTVCNVSCVPTKVSGTLRPALEATFNLAKPLELALFNGKDPLTGLQVGRQTGEQFHAYDDLLAAYKEQVRNALRWARLHSQAGQRTLAEIAPMPYRSVLVEDCMAKGQEILAGGARHSLSGCMILAGVDAGNGLAAVKKLVFDESRLTLDRLREALLADFEGYDDVFHMCLSAPKYGNGDEYVDAIVREIYAYCWDEHQKLGPDYLGRPAKPECYSVSIHNYMGEKTGALPGGHRARKPLTDASVSATPGTDRNGPTALLISAARAVDTVKYGSNHLNVKFHPTALEGESRAAKLISLIDAYMRMGGSHIQFNCVSADTLRAAQEHPEQYRDLVVRVAGFSAFFVLLDRRIQEEIIRRTEVSLR